MSASLVSLAHGTNDAQKTMGVVTLTLGAPDIQVGADGDPEGRDAVVSARVAMRPVAATIAGFAQPV